jgi:hypothetical protein
MKTNLETDDNTSRVKLAEIKIPISLLEIPIHQNQRQLLRFLSSIIGRRNAFGLIKAIIKKSDTSQHEKQSYAHFQEIFPNYKNLEIRQINNFLLPLFEKANDIVTEIAHDAYPETESLELLGSTNPTVNLVKILSQCFDESEPRYKFEKLRQHVIVLILLIINEQNSMLDNCELISDLQDLFEEEIYKGLKGSLTDVTKYSVHTTENNNCLDVFNSLEEAKKYVLKRKSNLTIKKHSFPSRQTDKMGLIFSDDRRKSPESLIKKIITNSLKGGSNIIEHNDPKSLADRIGFMFVAFDKNEVYVIKSIIDKIKIKYPNAVFVKRNQTGQSVNRGQSDLVKFKRYKIILTPNSQPVELIVFNPVDYFNYRYHSKFGHEKYNIDKSLTPGKVLFPEDIYHDVTGSHLDESRNRRDIEIAIGLKEKNSVNL